MAECKCGNCKAALAFLWARREAVGPATELALQSPSICEADNFDKGTIMSVARKVVATMNGSTMLMTLASGSNVVRFLVPSILLSPGGSAGKFAEGVATDMGTAMAIALAGLAQIIVTPS